jgi:hypothetical protein
MLDQVYRSLCLVCYSYSNLLLFRRALALAEVRTNQRCALCSTLQCCFSILPCVIGLVNILMVRVDVFIHGLARFCRFASFWLPSSIELI